MKTPADPMAKYAAHHHDARNRATHFAGVPAILLARFIPLSWLRFEAGPLWITAAMLPGGASCCATYLIRRSFLSVRRNLLCARLQTGAAGGRPARSEVRNEGEP
jgi:hypothetical protein